MYSKLLMSSIACALTGFAGRSSLKVALVTDETEETEPPPVTGADSWGTHTVMLSLDSKEADDEIGVGHCVTLAG
jgi:hypothetical protein